MILNRRSFLKNTAALIAAPGIAKASNIMPTGTYLGAYSEHKRLPDNNQPIIAGDWAHVVGDSNFYMYNGREWQPVMESL